MQEWTEDTSRHITVIAKQLYPKRLDSKKALKKSKQFDKECKVLTHSNWKDEDDERYVHFLCIIQGGQV